MAHLLDVALKVSLMLFMVGNLLDMGLSLKIAEAVAGLRNTRFIAQSLVWGFLLCPALAFLLTLVLPLAPPYALGLTLLGLAPCAPFLPMMVVKARGDLGYAAAFMLVVSLFTVLLMPVMVPVLAKGMTAGAWTIAKPLVLFLILPLAIGVAFRFRFDVLADRVLPVVKRLTQITTLVMLGLCVVLYGKGFVSAVGTFAIFSQIVFFSLTTVASFLLTFGLELSQKTVLSLGMATRNVGAALAPLFAVPDVDERAIVMVVLGVPMQVVAALLAARWFARQPMRPVHT